MDFNQDLFFDHKCLSSRESFWSISRDVNPVAIHSLWTRTY